MKLFRIHTCSIPFCKCLERKKKIIFFFSSRDWIVCFEVFPLVKWSQFHSYEVSIFSFIHIPILFAQKFVYLYNLVLIDIATCATLYSLYKHTSYTHSFSEKFARTYIDSIGIYSPRRRLGNSIKKTLLPNWILYTHAIYLPFLSVFARTRVHGVISSCCGDIPIWRIVFISYTLYIHERLFIYEFQCYSLRICERTHVGRCARLTMQNVIIALLV